MEKYKLPLLVKLTIGVAILIIIGAISVYVFEFGVAGNLGDQEQFGQLGDYIGGLTNPILTFLTVVLLIWSIQIQVKELDATRKELQETKKIHEQQLELNNQESIRRQLHDDANMYIKNCEELLDKPIFQVSPITNLPPLAVSVNDTFKNSRYYGEEAVGNLINEFPALIAENRGAESLHLHRIRTQLGFAISSVCHLLQYLEVKVLRTSWESRVRTLLTDCRATKIITDKEADDFELSLFGANVKKSGNE